VGRRVVLLGTALLIAAVGTLLVYLYVNRADDRALARQRPVEILVAARQVPAGTKAGDAFDQGWFVPRALPATALVPKALSSVAEIRDRLTRTAIYPGQQIVEPLFGETVSAPLPFALPEDRSAVSFQFNDPARVAGFVQPGSHVMVFLTSDLEGQSKTRLLLPDVQVVAVGQTAQGDTAAARRAAGAQPRGAGGGGSQALLTLALTQDEAQRMIFAAASGDLYLGLLREGSHGTPDKGIDKKSLFR
jgi:pilus assembly protein CpaB